MNYTDEQLQRALAKMLPDVCYVAANGVLAWLNQNGDAVLPTELPHLCWLVEETLNDFETYQYNDHLFSKTPVRFGSNASYWVLTHATWQQRTVALAKVKGVEIV